MLASTRNESSQLTTSTVFLSLLIYLTQHSKQTNSIDNTRILYTQSCDKMIYTKYITK